MEKTNFSEDLKQLKAMHMALTFGLLFICLLLYFISDKEQVALILAVVPVEVFAIVLTIINLLLVLALNRKKFPAVRRIEDKNEKWETYRRIEVWKYALVEASGLVCAIVFFLRGNLYLLLFSLVLTLLLYMMRPTRDKLVYGLRFEERDLE